MIGPVEIIAGTVDGTDFVMLMIPGKGCVEVVLPPGAACAQMRCMFVAPDCRRQGVGRMLFGRCVTFAQRHGRYTLAFTVRKDSPGAVEFYRSLGCVAFFEDGSDWWFSYVLRQPGKGGAG